MSEPAVARSAYRAPSSAHAVLDAARSARSWTALADETGQEANRQRGRRLRSHPNRPRRAPQNQTSV